MKLSGKGKTLARQVYELCCQPAPGAMCGAMLSVHLMMTRFISRGQPLGAMIRGPNRYLDHDILNKNSLFV